MAASQAPDGLTRYTPPALEQVAPELLRDLMLCSHDGTGAALFTSVLARIAACCAAERVLVLGLALPNWSCQGEWHAPELPAVQGILQDMPVTGFEPVIDRLLRHECVDSGPVDLMEHSAARAMMHQLGIARFIALPFTVDDRLKGALVLTLAQGQEPPGGDRLRLLGIVADGVNMLLSRWRNDQALFAARREQARTVARLTATLSAMPELLLEMDARGRCLDTHCSRPDLLVAPPELILGRTLEETLPPDVAALQRQAMADALRHGTVEAPPYQLGEGTARRWYRLTVARQDATTKPDAPADVTDARFVFLIRDITAERSRESQTRMLAQIVSDMPLAVVLFDQEMRIRWANPAFGTHLGLPVSALIGQRIRDFTDPEATGAETLARIDAAVAACRGFHGIGWRRIGGARRAIEILLNPCNDADGAFMGFISIERDITGRMADEAERARLAAEVAAAHDRQRAAIDALPDGFVIYDADDRLVLWNQRFEEINAPIAPLIRVGRRRTELIEAAFSAGLLPATAPGVPGLEELLDSGQPVSSEQTLADGRVFRVMGQQMPGGGHVVLLSEITDIRDARRRLAEVIDGARVATWDYDLVTGIETVNEHWATMLGEPPGSIRRIDDAAWFARAHPEDDAAIRAQLERIARGLDDRLEVEFRLRHRQGHWVHVISRGRVVARDAVGRPLRMSGVDIDVTERRQAEERLQAILEAAAIGTWQLDSATGRVIVDEAYARLLGYTLAELPPISHAQFESMVHPEDLSGIYRQIAAAAETGAERIDFEFRMRHRDGSWRWILSKTRIHAWGPNGLPLRESGVHLDITEARDREDALARARDDLAAALDAHEQAERRLADIAAVSEDWFWEQDAEGRFTYLSDGFERATGQPAGPPIGRTRQELGLDRAPTTTHDWDEFEAWIAARQPLQAFVYRVGHRDDGSPVWIRINGAPFFDAEGRFAGYRGVGSNVTELIQATEQAQAASRAKSSFLATMSHELRTPMTAVLGLTELLQDRVAEPELLDMLGTIRESGAGLLSVLDDILDLAKIEAGKLTIDPKPFAPADLARRCEALFGPRAESAGLAFGLSVWPGGEGHRLGDANRILQILNNLIGNAIKFTRRGGVRLTITPQGHDDRLIRFTVEDDGIGMSPDQLTRVFDEFEQAETSTARRYGGTGLGLSITRRLVALLEGDLEVDSREGRGTRIAVTLPLPGVAGTARPPDPAPEPGAEVVLSGLRVLVADDNATNRRILQAMLTGLGLKVTLAEDGRQALSCYRPDGFDLLLLDISMPELDGPAALAAMRAQDGMAGAPSPPAVAVTAHAMAHQIAEILEAGFAGHLAKPFSKAGLARVLADCLRDGAHPLAAAPVRA